MFKIENKIMIYISEQISSMDLIANGSIEQSLNLLMLKYYIQVDSPKVYILFLRRHQAERSEGLSSLPCHVPLVFLVCDVSAGSEWVESTHSWSVILTELRFNTEKLNFIFFYF